MNLLRVILRVVGSLAVLLGVWWILQGTGIAPVGFMANHIEWAYRGAGLALVGFILVTLSRRL
jgi:formate hydrogenlyase subunit 3/multisubunit Na+/H+ antiporter MnhD subunit